MQVTRARQVATDWIAAQVDSGTRIEAAFLHGSITWLENGAVILPASDVDILVVAGSSVELPIRGKHVVDGLALDVSTIDRTELEPVAKLLATYHLAGSLRSSESILFDPEGWLTGLHKRVGRDFARSEWVRMRCAHAIRRIHENLTRVKSAETHEDRMISWLFAAGVSTHVLLVAGLRNPTVRSRYAAVREMLDELGHTEMYPPLIDLLDPGQSSATDVQRLIQSLAPLFDLAVQKKQTWFHFSEDVSSAGRIGAIDSANEMVQTGNPRDALFWIGVTAARCMVILNADGTESERARYEPYLDDLRRLFGLDSAQGIESRTQSLHDLLPVLLRNSETLISERAW